MEMYMIFDVQQIQNKYQVMYLDEYLGDVCFLKKQNGWFFNTGVEYAVAKQAANAIKSVFSGPITVQNKRKKFVVYSVDSNEKFFTLLHTYKNKNKEQTLVDNMGNKLGTVFKNRKHIIFDTTNGDQLHIGCFNSSCADAAYNLAKTYGREIKVKLNGNIYVIRPNMTVKQVHNICSSISSGWFHHGKMVAETKYTGNAFEYYPLKGVPLKKALDGMCGLATFFKKPVTFMYDNKTKNLLYHLYLRELTRKK